MEFIINIFWLRGLMSKIAIKIFKITEMIMTDALEVKHVLSIEQTLSTFENDFISINDKLWIRFYLIIYLFFFNWIMYFLRKNILKKFCSSDYDVTNMVKLIFPITIVVNYFFGFISFNPRSKHNLLNQKYWNGN